MSHLKLSPYATKYIEPVLSRGLACMQSRAFINIGILMGRHEAYRTCHGKENKHG
jgi:hypothetical protein